METSDGQKKAGVEQYLGFEVHPLVQDYPWMRDTAELKTWTEFCEGIRVAGGITDPIVLHEGKILDGRHRAKAVEELRREGREISSPTPLDWQQGKHGTSPEEFAEQRNALRNHWNEDQRAVWGFRKYWAKEESDAAERKEQSRFGASVAQDSVSTGDFEEKKSRRANTTKERVATRAGVTGTRVERVRRVLEVHGDDALTKVFSGEKRLKDYPVIASKKGGEQPPNKTPPKTQVKNRKRLPADAERTEIASAARQAWKEMLADFTADQQEIVRCVIRELLAGSVAVTSTSPAIAQQKTRLTLKRRGGLFTSADIGGDA